LVLLECQQIDQILRIDCKLNTIAFFFPLTINLASYELLDDKMFLGCWIEHLVHSVEQRCELVIAIIHIQILLLSDSPVSTFEQTSEFKRESVFGLNQLLYQIVRIGNRLIHLLKRNAELVQTSNIILFAHFD